jgi:hypothetical protein
MIDPNQMPREGYVGSASDERTVNNDENAVRHDYRVLNEQEKADMVEIKDAGLAFLKTIKKFPPCREMSLAATKCEEAVMWAVKGITK